MLLILNLIYNRILKFRYQWLRGGKPVRDIVTSAWTVDPVGLHSRTNISCFAHNEGGNGLPATVLLDVHGKIYRKI